MKITRRQLKRLIQEQMSNIQQDVHDVIRKFQGAMGQRQWSKVRNEFYNMSEGGDEYGIRQTYYQGWTNGDFISVIIAVEGSYSP
jgi:hypothetical protein